YTDKLQAFSDKVVEPQLRDQKLNATMDFHLQPIRDIHLSNDFMYEWSPSGNKKYVYIFGFVALFILLIASINYMNLATARSSKRAKEVGLRKVIGAYKSQLIRQFIGESVLITLLAVVLALVLVELLLPTFNSLTDKNFSTIYLLNGQFLLALLAMVVLVGVLAGSYPAFFLSGFKPVEVLKSDKSPRGSSAWLRKGLVVTQFTLSLIMIIGTIVVFRQMQFLKKTDLGFNKEQMVVVDIPSGDSTLVNSLPNIKNELLQNPKITKVATTANIPGEEVGRLLFRMGKDGQRDEKAMSVMFVDPDFTDVMDMEFAIGRGFSKDMATDQTKALVVNEATVKWMGWKNPIGQKMTYGKDTEGTIVGVVKDFHYKSLHSEIEPLVLIPVPKNSGYLLARVAPGDVQSTIGFIEEKWSKFDPNHPMEYFFLDEKFDEQYRAEEKMLAVFGYFAALTILIACLGLFGLASYTAEQRTKEIGIRKVLGSSVSEIVLLLSKDFAVLVVVAIVLASPIAWYGMNKWLQDFAYRTPLSIWIFALAGAAALIIAMLTVSSQAAKAAMLNPIKTLRSE
ncbi:MAG: FtsX-like permease family protein, partial [Hymenobacteraceae bacterium]|nr:FtsX-like permease family protein [Hymenobacteraceae bacterium]MDX5397860.1 FtsX-like permease family protein [Hymenobacteraceae bacterium]MDX5513932.1 FtsX-like permease family protein [Hymenobacteraceae bacterium]